MLIEFDVIPNCFYSLFGFFYLDFSLLWLFFAGLELLFGIDGFEVELWYVPTVISIINFKMPFFPGFLNFLCSVGFEFYILLGAEWSFIAWIRFFKLMTIWILLFNKLTVIIIFFDIKYVGLLIFHISWRRFEYIVLCFVLIWTILKLSPIEL